MGRRKAKRTSKQLTAVAKPWTALKVDPKSTGAFPGESVGEALRRQVAWIALGLRQVDKPDIPFEMIAKGIREAAQTVMTLSLEVDELERADEHNQKLVGA